MNLASLAVRLRELFETLQESKTRPIILLVHDQEVTRSVLQCAGVDISQCQIGIQNLLHYQESEVCASWYPGLIILNILHIKDTLLASRQDRRSRSRSPRRDSKNNTGYKSLFPGDYTAQGSRKDYAYSRRSAGSFAPIYVIDVQSMYRRLMQTDGRGKDPPGKDVASTARELSLSGSKTGWCAGNECGCVTLLWKNIMIR
jgi:hypothetical protein